MDKVLAYEIDSCVVCEGLYFPGDELIVTREGDAHDYCAEKISSEQNLALSS